MDRHIKYNFKRFFCIFLAFVMLFSLAACGKKQGSENDTEEALKPLPPLDENGCRFKTEGKYFSMYNGEKYEDIYIKGVNIGSGKPGYFPGEFGISKDEYLRWFDEISDMNCNSIRVYTLMMPCFYEALLEYNRNSEKELWLFQGLWYDEETLLQTNDAYSVLDDAKEEGMRTVDALHGNADIPERAGRAYGQYDADVSTYVIGWILGIESDAELVITTNDLHQERSKYTGAYLKTDADSSPYEAFMCEFGDGMLEYETEKYGMQRPISWCNWPTTDPLTHNNEPNQVSEDAVSIDFEHIKACQEFNSGIFASYHIYPYHPDFMMYQPEYAAYKDENGNPNTYRAYLNDLIAYHTMPVLVAEYGVPTSRGITHKNVITGFNHGGHTEEEQGQMIVSMSNDIHEAGYCGGLIFAWQDEWFKKTWNTKDFSDASRRPYWNDFQTSEPNFGLLAFDNAELGKTEIILDGDPAEWSDCSPISQDTLSGLNVYAETDAKYLYLMIGGDSLNPETDRVLIPLDITPLSGSGQYKDGDISAEFAGDAADFVIDINGRENSKMRVHSYYDIYAFNYGAEDRKMNIQSSRNPGNKEFVPVYMILSYIRLLPLTNAELPQDKYDTGILRYGKGDPYGDDYDSISDFCFGDHCIEIRIPWLMLNFRDPSSKEVEGDFWADGKLSGLYVDSIGIGVGKPDETIEMSPFTWDDWGRPTYRERLKKSYYIMQECFAALP